MFVFLILRHGKDGGQKEYYTLDCILFLLRNVNFPHALYVRQAAVSIMRHMSQESRHVKFL